MVRAKPVYTCCVASVTKRRLVFLRSRASGPTARSTVPVKLRPTRSLHTPTVAEVSTGKVFGADVGGGEVGAATGARVAVGVALGSGPAVTNATGDGIRLCCGGGAGRFPHPANAMTTSAAITRAGRGNTPVLMLCP
jgi:hypothetical protein